MNGRKMQKSKRTLKHNSIEGLIACALMLTGCAQPQHQEVVEQICLPDTQKLQAMQMAEDVLDRMNFTIAKADTEQGLIRTKPLPAAQSFEFWRSDNVGSFNSTEANLHSIRRTAELDISQEGTQSIQVLELHPEQKEGMAWIDLGSDKQLATDILKRIEKSVKLEE
jgi:protease II